MKPISITLKNFGCYQGETFIDFRQPHNLFGIVGKTGSGKSTILDAITFALYGQTQRLGKRGAAAALAHPGTDNLAVTLTFSVNGQNYLVYRSFNGKSEVQVSKEVGTTWRRVKETDKISEADAYLEQVVGLDYDSFVRAVLLPQGAFDEFLKGDAAKRHEVLTRLLGTETIESIRYLANNRAKEFQARIGYIDEDLEQNYSNATEEAREGAEAHIFSLTEDIDNLQARIGDYEKREREHEQLKGLTEQWQSARGTLESLAEKLPRVEKARERIAKSKAAETLRPQVERVVEAAKAHAEAQQESSDLDEKLADSNEATKKAQEELERAKTKRDDQVPEWREQLQAIVDLDGELGRLRAIEPLAKAYRAAADHLDRIQKDIADRDQRLKEARKGLDDYREEYAKAEERVGVALEKLNKAKHSNAAHHIRAGLDIGDTCPVCDQTINRLPEEEPASIDETPLRREAKEAEDAFREVHTNVIATEGHIGALMEAAKTAAHDLKRYQEGYQMALEELSDALTEFTTDLDDLPDSYTRLIQDRKARLEELCDGDSVAVAQQVVNDIIIELEETVNLRQDALAKLQNEKAVLEAQVEAAQKAENRAYNALEIESSKLDEALEASELDDDIQAHEVQNYLLSDNDRAEFQRRIDEFEERRTEAERDLNDALAGLNGMVYDEEAHAEVTGTLVVQRKMLSNLRESLGAQRKQLEYIEERIERAAKLQEEKAGLEKQHTLHARLAQLLRRDNFQAYLLAHAQADLATQASVTIGQITDDRYRLDYHDNEYFVTDTWFDEYERSVKTLSGGETFIVSLALALALSDVIAGVNRLEALFLDEGFGTLDPTMLDSVSTALTNLSEDGRMVGVITHVESLTDRLPLRLRVDKSQGGSTVAWEG